MIQSTLFVHEMAPPCSRNHTRVIAIAVLCLLLFIRWSCCSNHLTSATFLTLFVLVLSLSFFLPRIRKLGKDHSAEKPSDTYAGLPQDDVAADDKATSKEELVTFHIDAAVTGPELDPSMEVQENLSRSASQCSNFDDDYESSPEDACQSTESSEDEISDDENLIEISFPDGHFVAAEEPKALLKPLPDTTRRGLILTNLLPESVLRQQGLMELLSEINEEDNLIEIDITRGSIKCSRMGIKAS